MSKTFFISDTHFGHYNAACVFTRDDGTPLRGFKSVEEMDEHMISKWNSVVSPKDRVYHVGDFCMNRKYLKTYNRLNGRIAVILGNHDIWKLEDYKQFQNIDQLCGVRMFPKLGWVVTHVPIHDRQLQGRWTHNIHGHLHYQRVVDKHGKIDLRYFNVSVECINYTPIDLEDLENRLKNG